MGRFYNPTLVAIFYLLVELRSSEAESYRKCDPHHLSDCPDMTTCSQAGECRCPHDYVFNPTYNKEATDYCIYRPLPTKSVTETVKKSGSSSPAIVASAAAVSSGKISSTISQDEPPGSHHLIGGILLPLGFVLIVIGAVLVVKRSNLVRRVREAFTRRNRPFYEDVMMGHDNDDPPLI